jgi:hypothetical protein
LSLFRELGKVHELLTEGTTMIEAGFDAKPIDAKVERALEISKAWGSGLDGVGNGSLSSIVHTSRIQVLSNPVRSGSGGRFTSRKMAKGLSFGFWARASRYVRGLCVFGY